MYTKSEAIEAYRPEVTPNQVGDVMVSDGQVEVVAAQIALNALVGLCVLPAGCVPVEFTLIEDDLDTGTALVQAVGVLNSTEDDLVASTNFITGATVGRAGGKVNADQIPDALKAPSTSDRIIAVKTTTGGILAVKATCKITSTGVNVTADKVVVINGKTYTLVDEAPNDEGDVLIGASAAETLANLALAVLRTDPTTNDGVKYKVAAAHTTVGVKTVTDTVLTLEALTAGAAGNAYTCTTDETTYTVDANQFDNGVTAVPLQGGTIRGILEYRASEYDV